MGFISGLVISHLTMFVAKIVLIRGSRNRLGRERDPNSRERRYNFLILMSSP